MAEKFKKVAVIDGIASGQRVVSLYWADRDDEMIEEIDWPDDWPQVVSTEFMEARGYEVIVA